MKEPTNPQDAIQQASVLLNKGHYTDAERLLNSVLTVIPSYPAALHLLGLISFHRGAVDQAIDLITQALKKAPFEYDYLANVCEMCRKQGRVDEAIEFGERAIAINPRAHSALSNLGIAYFDRGDYQKARDLQRKALKIAPTHIPALNNIGNAYRQLNEYTRAKSSYEKALRLAPNNIDARSNLGALLIAMNELEEAEVHLRTAVELDPTYASAHTQLGRVLEATNRPDEAREAFVTATKLRTYAEPFLRLAHLDLKHCRFEQALKSAEVAYRLESRNETLALLGEIHHQLGNVEQALSCFERANTSR